MPTYILDDHYLTPTSSTEAASVVWKALETFHDIETTCPLLESQVVWQRGMALVVLKGKIHPRTKCPKHNSDWWIVSFCERVWSFAFSFLPRICDQFNIHCSQNDVTFTFQSLDHHLVFVSCFSFPIEILQDMEVTIFKISTLDITVILCGIFRDGPPKKKAIQRRSDEEPWDSVRDPKGSQGAGDPSCGELSHVNHVDKPPLSTRKEFFFEMWGI